MWGHGGIGSVIIDGLQKKFPTKPTWREVMDANSKTAKHEAVGVVKSEDELQRWLSQGYWLTNYEPGELSLFNPPPMNGLAMYVLGELAEKYAPRHDPWNYRVFQERESGG